MRTIAQAASAIALTLAASSAGAWYGVPYQSACMTDEQKQALVQQQQAMAAQQQEMAAQYAKAAEQAMAAQQTAMKQMADQQAAYMAEMQKNAQTGQVAPSVAAPTVALADPFAGYAYGPLAGPGLPVPPVPELAPPPAPPMPERLGFDRPAFPEIAAPSIPDMPPMPEMPSFDYPAMPEMPSFDYPAMPDFAGPAGSESAAPQTAAGIPSRPAAPGYVGERLKEMDAQRAKARQESDARRAALKDMNERRRATRAFYRPHGPRAGRFGYGPMGAPGMPMPGMECGSGAAPAPAAAPTAPAPGKQQTAAPALAPVAPIAKVQ